MKIIVKAKPRAREKKVELLTQTPLDLGGVKNELAVYKVSVIEPPVDGKANEAIIKALAEHFKIPASQFRLISGVASRQKVFEIIESK